MEVALGLVWSVLSSSLWRLWGSVIFFCVEELAQFGEFRADEGIREGAEFLIVVCVCGWD